MKYPVRTPMIVTQGFSEKHEAVDLRNTDLKTHITYPHFAIEASTIIDKGKGKTYGENFILLLGESGLYYLYCHNTLMPGIIDTVDEGQEFGLPDISGENTKGYHLHLEIWSRMPIGKQYFRLNPLEIFDDNNLKWKYK